MALREYVPGSRVLAGGDVIRSRGLMISRRVTGHGGDGMGMRGQLRVCAQQHGYYSISGEVPERCPLCNEAGGPTSPLLFPRHGYSSAVWDPPQRGAHVNQVGHTEISSVTFVKGGDDWREADFGGVQGLLARYREDGEILGYNSGQHERGFAICTRCGFAESERKPGKKGDELPLGFARHSTLSWFGRCWKDDERPVLRHQHLAAREQTDVLLLDPTDRALRDESYSEAAAVTLGHALQIAGARLLEVDTRELGVLQMPVGEGGELWAPVLYDNVPGGAGHVLELAKMGVLWLLEAQQVLWVDEDHDGRCTTACLDCVLTFDAQTAVARGLLDRHAALKLLDQWQVIS